MNFKFKFTTISYQSLPGILAYQLKEHQESLRYSSSNWHKKRPDSDICFNK